MAEPAVESPSPETPVPSRGRRVLLALAVIAVIMAGLGHAMGGRTSARVLVIAGAVLAVLLVLWLWLRLVRYFHPSGRRQRGSLNYPGQRGRGFRQPFRLSGRHASPFRHAGTARRGSLNYPSQRGRGFRQPSRRSGAVRRAGSARRRVTAAPGNLIRRHRPSAAANGRGGAGRRNLRRPFRRTGSSQGGVRRPLPGSRRFRPGSRAPGRTARGSRVFPRFRRAGHTSGAGGARRRSRFPRLLPRFRRRPRAAGAPARAGRLRRAWHRRLGIPQQRHNRRAARRARRARLRAWRRKLQVNPYTHRIRWHAPWRLWTRGPGLRAQFRRWRARHGHAVPRHPRSGRKLPWRARIARRWRIRRGRHPGFGPGGRRRDRLPWRDRLSLRMLAARFRRLRRRFRLRRWLAGRLRGRPPPRPLAGGRHRVRGWFRRVLSRLDRRRMDRWARRRRRHAPPVPVPWPAAPRPAGAPRNAHPGARLNGNSTRGGKTVDTHAMADEIRSMGSAEFADPQDVHDTLAGMHELVQSMQDVLNGWGLSLAETGVHPVYSETVQEAAGAMSGIADQLQSVLSGGVMRGPGG